MRVFVAGATDAIGKQLVPGLVAAGREVHGMTRSESKQAMLDELGAVPVAADARHVEQRGSRTVTHAIRPAGSSFRSHPKLAPPQRRTSSAWSPPSDEFAARSGSYLR
jgi:nucleoside-diphosphate-sugar epimerase